MNELSRDFDPPPPPEPPPRPPPPISPPDIPDRPLPPAPGGSVGDDDLRDRQLVCAITTFANLKAKAKVVNGRPSDQELRNMAELLCYNTGGR